MKTKLLLTGLAFMAFTAFAGAQTANTNNQQTTTPGNRGAWIDENKNGVCDYYETRQGNRGQGFGGGRYGAGRGNRNNGGNWCGRGPGRGNGRGMGPGRGQGRPGGRNYIDDNKNGVCDYFENNTPADK
ncbi:MAG TPA: hypothetical protein PL123_10025 [Bacteroidales bacterium]|nr:hypothetical protein [Bacteroidales bacterium]